MFLSDISRRFFLVSDPRCRLRGLGGKLWSACEELEDIDGGNIWLMFLRLLVLAHLGCHR